MRYKATKTLITGYSFTIYPALKGIFGMLSTKRVKISVILIGDIVKNNVRLVINKGEAKAEIHKKLRQQKFKIYSNLWSIIFSKSIAAGQCLIGTIGSK